MTAVLACLIIGLAIVLAIVLVVVLGPRYSPRPTKPVAGGLDHEDLKLVIAALISDRERLISAALAREPNSTPARTLGLMDQAQAKVTRSEVFEQMAARRDAELIDEHGEPIIPVGLGSQA